jgi:predicted transcriptional regulator
LVYSACLAEAKSIDQLATESGIDPAHVEDVLSECEQLGLLFRSDGLALALAVAEERPLHNLSLRRS